MKQSSQCLRRCLRLRSGAKTTLPLVNRSRADGQFPGGLRRNFAGILQTALRECSPRRCQRKDRLCCVEFGILMQKDDRASRYCKADPMSQQIQLHRDVMICHNGARHVSRRGAVRIKTQCLIGRANHAFCGVLSHIARLVHNAIARFSEILVLGFCCRDHRAHQRPCH